MNTDTKDIEAKICVHKNYASTGSYCLCCGNFISSTDYKLYALEKRNKELEAFVDGINNHLRPLATQILEINKQGTVKYGARSQKLIKLLDEFYNKAERLQTKSQPCKDAEGEK